MTDPAKTLAALEAEQDERGYGDSEPRDVVLFLADSGCAHLVLLRSIENRSVPLILTVQEPGCRDDPAGFCLARYNARRLRDELADWLSEGADDE